MSEIFCRKIFTVLERFENRSLFIEFADSIKESVERKDWEWFRNAWRYILKLNDFQLPDKIRWWFNDITGDFIVEYSKPQPLISPHTGASPAENGARR